MERFRNAEWLSNSLFLEYLVRNNQYPASSNYLSTNTILCYICSPRTLDPGPPDHRTIGPPDHISNFRRNKNFPLGTRNVRWCDYSLLVGPTTLHPQYRILYLLPVKHAVRRPNPTNRGFGIRNLPKLAILSTEKIELHPKQPIPTSLEQSPWPVSTWEIFLLI